MTLIGIQTLVVGAILGWAVTPPVIWLGRKIGAVDHPGPRKVHISPIPRIGGLAVFAAFLGALVYAAWATGYVYKFPVGGFYWTTLAVGAGVMLLLGLVDDLVGVSYKWKFVVQILVASSAWVAGFRVESITVPLVGSSLDLGLLSWFATVFWIVGITNAINLIDGLDGLAAGSALITTLTMAVIALVGGKVAVTAVCIALAGSLLGFLRYNFNPARIFLGDSGSMFLGYVLAVISIYGSQKTPAAVAVLAPLLVLGLPILDTLLAILRRTLRLFREASKGPNGPAYALRNLTMVFHPDRQHLHHRLLEIGMSHRGAVLALYLLGAILAAFALAQVTVQSLAVGLLLAGTLLGLMLAGVIAYHWAKTARSRGRPGGPGSASLLGRGLAKPRGGVVEDPR